KVAGEFSRFYTSVFFSDSDSEHFSAGSFVVSRQGLGAHANPRGSKVARVLNSRCGASPATVQPVLNLFICFSTILNPVGWSGPRRFFRAPLPSAGAFGRRVMIAYICMKSLL